MLKTRICFSAVYYFISLFVACQFFDFCFLQTLRMRSAIRSIISLANSWWAKNGASFRHCAAEPNAKKRDARCALKVFVLSRHSARHTLETTEESLRLSFSLPRSEREVRSRIRRRTAASIASALRLCVNISLLVDKTNMDFAAERSVTKDDLWTTETIAKYALKLRASERANIVLAVALLSRLENWRRRRLGALASSASLAKSRRRRRRCGHFFFGFFVLLFDSAKWTKLCLLALVNLDPLQIFKATRSDYYLRKNENEWTKQRAFARNELKKLCHTWINCFLSHQQFQNKNAFCQKNEEWKTTHDI